MELLKGFMGWSEIITYPGIYLVTGKRGSGKSALGYWLVEYFGNKLGLTMGAVGLPQEKHSLLPQNFITPSSPEDFPEDAALFIDEGSFLFHAREFKDRLNILMDKLISISRQRCQLVFIAVHQTRKLDVALVSDVDGMLLKEPGQFHTKFERKEIREITEEAKSVFERLTGDKRTYTWAVTEKGRELLTNPLPSFWNEELSLAFAGVPFISRSGGQIERSSAQTVPWDKVMKHRDGTFYLAEEDVPRFMWDRAEFLSEYLFKKSACRGWRDPVTGIDWLEDLKKP